MALSWGVEKKRKGECMLTAASRHKVADTGTSSRKRAGQVLWRSSSKVIPWLVTGAQSHTLLPNNTEPVQSRADLPARAE